MAQGAPKENQYHLLRKRAGPHYIFETGEELEAAFLEYFEWIDENPMYKTDCIRSGERAGEVMYCPVKRPYTFYGFQAYHKLGINYIKQLKDNLLEKERLNKTTEKEKALSLALAWATGVCTADKLEGAAVGIYNPMIIARDLGLKEHTEATGANDTPLFPTALVLRMPEGLNIDLPNNTDGDGTEDDVKRNETEQ